MNFKKMITLIEMLALTGIMSVGFSTWVIVETNFPEIHVQVETENVFNTNEFLTIKNITFSDYDANGFYVDYIYSSDTSTRSKTGYLEFDIIVNLSKCSMFEENLSFEFSMSTNPNNSKFDLIGNSSIIKRESSTYSLNDSSNTKGNISEAIKTKTEYTITVAGAQVVRYKLDDSFEIATSNRSDILTCKLKYSFELTNDKFNEFYGKSNDALTTNNGIDFSITALMKGNE